MRYGDLFQCKKFPDLKQIVQISHKTIPGTEKFKHCLNYTKSYMTNLALPKASSNDVVFEIHSDKGKKTISHEESLENMHKFNENFVLGYDHNIVNSAPIFYPVNFTLGFLGSMAKNACTVIPGNYNFVDMLKLIDSQKSSLFICEDDLLETEISNDVLQDVRKITDQVEDVVVFSNEEQIKQVNLENFKKAFNQSRITFFDEYSFRKIG